MARKKYLEKDGLTIEMVANTKSNYEEKVKDLYLRIIKAKMEGEHPTVIQKMQQEYDRLNREYGRQKK